jgi:hypothetical protein
MGELDELASFSLRPGPPESLPVVGRELDELASFSLRPGPPESAVSDGCAAGVLDALEQPASKTTSRATFPGMTNLIRQEMPGAAQSLASRLKYFCSSTEGPGTRSRWS